MLLLLLPIDTCNVTTFLFLWPSRTISSSLSRDYYQIPMAELRGMLASPPLNFVNVQTLLQTGNIVFGCKDDTVEKESLTKKIQDEIESHFGVRSIVMLRTLDELKSVLLKIPFAVGDEEGR